MYSLTLVEPAQVEPCSLAQAKSFCTVSSSFTDDDALITSLISAARVVAENYCRRQFFNATWTLGIDFFPTYYGRASVKAIHDSSYPYQEYFDGMMLLLPKPTCVSVTSIKYLDQTGTQQTMPSDTYVVDTASEPARLMPINDNSWPTMAFYIPGSVQIQYVAGSFGDGIEVNTCPQSVTTAICLYTAWLYANREGAAACPDAFYRLLDSVKFTSFGYNLY